MKRDLRRISETRHDLLVIGGGITGAAIAWDAALRGLTVALVEKQDFGGATSANSLKTVHGGLRYLQDLDPGLVRKMIRERKALLRIAPHLVRPLPVMMPTYTGRLMRSRLVLGTAIKLNDLTSLDRNRGLGPAHSLPGGQILSRRELVELAPGIDDQAVSGGVVWHDAQIQNTERLTLAFVQAAVGQGAQAANHAPVSDLLRDGQQITGARVVDALTGETHDVRAGIVVNAAGPWVDRLLQPLDRNRTRPLFTLSSAVNLVTRQILPTHALGIDSQYEHQRADGQWESRSRVLFIAPWQGYSIVGTLHAPYHGEPDKLAISAESIRSFLQEVNRAYPGAQLQSQDVYHVHQGLLPMEPDSDDPTTVTLIRAGQVTDHATDDGIQGLISAVGVKYTTGRYLAEKVLDLVFEKLRRPSPGCLTHLKPLVGGNLADWDEFVGEIARNWPAEVERSQMPRLLTNYGTVLQELLPVLAERPEWRRPVAADTSVTAGEVVFAARNEMAERLSDVVLRRTEMGSARGPSAAALSATATVMAQIKGWDETKTRQEIESAASEGNQKRYPD